MEGASPFLNFDSSIEDLLVGFNCGNEINEFLAGRCLSSLRDGHSLEKVLDDGNHVFLDHTTSGHSSDSEANTSGSECAIKLEC